MTLSDGAVKGRAEQSRAEQRRQRVRATHLDELRHFASLLFRLGRVLLLHHAQPRYRQLELHFELVLGLVSLVVLVLVPVPRSIQSLCKQNVRRVIVPAASLLQTKDM